MNAVRTLVRRCHPALICPDCRVLASDAREPTHQCTSPDCCHTMPWAQRGVLHAAAPLPPTDAEVRAANRDVFLL